MEEEYARPLGMGADPMKEDFETKAEHSRLIEAIANILQIKNFIRDVFLRAIVDNEGKCFNLQ